MQAPRSPGMAPTWSSSAKDMVGCALGPARLWFTTGFGIVNEVYYPRADIPQIRDLGFIVSDGRGFWVEVKRLHAYRVQLPAPGIPAVEIVHTHARFELRLRIAPDATRDVLLIEVTLTGDDSLRPYALLAPHLGGTGWDNLAATATYAGRKVLWAEQGPFGLALAASDAKQRDAWGATSAGVVGESDGWQDFARNGALTWSYDAAGPGNVALIGELPQKAVLALGFGTSRESAATLCLSSLAQSFVSVWDRQLKDWNTWHRRLCLPMGLPASLQAPLITSAMVLRTHQDKTYPGAMVASLSIPWGNSHDDIGGYHLVWPRDLVESAGALLALGAVDEACDLLRYLIASQQNDGHWSQNQWLGGKPFWHGTQLDETAFPILLTSAMFEQAALDGIEIENMVRRALIFIARNGPCTEQDRWEEDAGINAFTLAVCISALVCGARWLDESARRFALQLADYWNSCIETWTAAYDTPLAQSMGVSGYYVRIAPSRDIDGRNDLSRVLPIKNLASDPGLMASEQVSTDFLQLVRLGLRDAHDPLIVATLKVVDAKLKVDTPAGTSWHRYTNDGYGETADGEPFCGVGVGRAWPLLTGERGHYEIAAGRDPLAHLETMAAMTGPSGLMPEQVWDTEALPDKFLFPGKPSGSAMPLAWTHSEFIKLAASRAMNAPFDRPKTVWERYGGQRPTVNYVIWTLRLPIDELTVGHALYICVPDAARVHWGRSGWDNSGWRQITDTDTRDTGLGLHIVEISTDTMQSGDSIDFTFYWIEAKNWQGRDYRVTFK